MRLQAILQRHPQSFYLNFNLSTFACAGSKFDPAQLDLERISLAFVHVGSSVNISPFDQ